MRSNGPIYCISRGVDRMSALENYTFFFLVGSLVVSLSFPPPLLSFFLLSLFLFYLSRFPFPFCIRLTFFFFPFSCPPCFIPLPFCIRFPDHFPSLPSLSFALCLVSGRSLERWRCLRKNPRRGRSRSPTPRLLSGSTLRTMHGCRPRFAGCRLDRTTTHPCPITPRLDCLLQEGSDHPPI